MTVFMPKTAEYWWQIHAKRVGVESLANIWLGLQRGLDGDNTDKRWFWQDGSRYLPTDPEVFDRWADNHPSADWVGLCVVSRQVGDHDEDHAHDCTSQDDYNQTYYPWESESCNVQKENDLDEFEYRAICVDKMEGPKVTCNTTGLNFEYFDGAKTNGTAETSGVPTVRSTN